jgi:hypothetical protein
MNQVSQVTHSPHHLSLTVKIDSPRLTAANRMESVTVQAQHRRNIGALVTCDGALDCQSGEKWRGFR